MDKNNVCSNWNLHILASTLSIILSHHGNISRAVITISIIIQIIATVWEYLRFKHVQRAFFIIRRYAQMPTCFGFERFNNFPESFFEIDDLKSLCVFFEICTTHPKIFWAISSAITWGKTDISWRNSRLFTVQLLYCCK